MNTLSKNTQKLVQKWSQNHQKIVKNGPWGVPGPSWGTIEKIIDFLCPPMTTFCGFWLPFGRPWGSHFRLFLVVCSHHFLKHRLKTFFEELGSHLASNLVHLFTLFGRPGKSENRTPAAAGALFSRIQGVKIITFLNSCLEQVFDRTFDPLFADLGSIWGSLWSTLGTLFSLFFLLLFLERFFNTFLTLLGPKWEGGLD